MYIAKTRTERKQEIEAWFAAHQMEGGSGLTMRSVAKGLGMSASGHLMTLLWEMVDEGILKADPCAYCNGMTSWRFAVQPHRLYKLQKGA